MTSVLGDMTLSRMVQATIIRKLIVDRRELEPSLFPIFRVKRDCLFPTADNFALSFVIRLSSEAGE